MKYHQKCCNMYEEQDDQLFLDKVAIQLASTKFKGDEYIREVDRISGKHKNNSQQNRLLSWSVQRFLEGFNSAFDTVCSYFRETLLHLSLTFQNINQMFVADL